jgi:enoyl-CoA hydratase/carnithine racemase
MSEQPVTLDVRGGIATITLNRPESMNAVNKALARALHDHIDAAEEDPGVKVILLRGEGRAFSAGADLKDPETHTAENVADHLRHSDRDGARRVWSATKPVIAAVHGYCIGVGVEIVLAADITVADETATFFLPQVKLGIIPGAGGIAQLVRRVGRTWASKMVLTSDRVAAATAAEIGLVTECVGEDGAYQRALEIAEGLAEAPAAAVLVAKDGLRECEEMPLQQALRHEQYLLYSLLDTDEKKQAHEAFAKS